MAKEKTSVVMPIVIAAVIFPVAMVCCLGNMVIRVLMMDETAAVLDGYNVVSPARWLAATIIPILMVLWGLKRKGLDMSGAMLALFVGFVLTLSSYSFMACMIVFFFTSSKVTKVRGHLKRKLESDYKEGGQRNWIQVLCNGAIATEFALLYILDAGCGERPIDFMRDYRASWLGIGILGAIACCNGDTWASELGSVFGTSDPVLVTSWKRVPRGTNGGVTIFGIIVSFVGGLVVGVPYYMMVLYLSDSTLLHSSPPQWPIIIMGGIGGLCGSLVDSVLGATVQYSGFDKERGKIVEKPGPHVEYISGNRILDNHSVNLVSSIAVAFLLPKLAMVVWP